MKVLVIIDLIKDFCPGGSFAVKDGDKIVRVVNELMAKGGYSLKVAVSDRHPKNHIAFAANHPGKAPFDVIKHMGGEQTLWVTHGVDGTPGAEFHDDLDISKIDKVFYKGTHPDIDSLSGFWDDRRVQETGLRAYIEQEAIKRGVDVSEVQVDVVGLALDYCVAFTAQHAKEIYENVAVILDATRAVNNTPRR